MALIVPQQIVLVDGIVPTYETCEAGGDEFVNSGQIVIHMKNANATLPRSVIIDTYTKCNYGLDTEHDVTVVVPAGPGEIVIGPFPKSRFNDALGRVQLTYTDGAADLSIAVVDLP